MVRGEQRATHRGEKTRCPGGHARPIGPRGRGTSRGDDESLEGHRHGGRDDGMLYPERARRAKERRKTRDGVIGGPKHAFGGQRRRTRKAYGRQARSGESRHAEVRDT